MNSTVVPHPDPAPSAPLLFEALRASRTALLTTFRRNGRAVTTMVEIHVVDGKAYFQTWSTTGKIKRLTNNLRVTLVPCTMRGEVIGPTIEGIARRLEGSEAVRANSMLGGKFQRWLWKLVYRLRWHADQVLYEVSPISTE